MSGASRLSRADWLDAGLSLLAREGRGGLRIELAARAWSGTSDAARETRKRVDRRRLNYRAGLNQAEFGLAAAAARQLAELEYAAYAGCQMPFPDTSGARKRARTRRLDALLGLAAGD